MGYGLFLSDPKYKLISSHFYLEGKLLDFFDNLEKDTVCALCTYKNKTYLGFNDVSEIAKHNLKYYK